MVQQASVHQSLGLWHSKLIQYYKDALSPVASAVHMPTQTAIKVCSHNCYFNNLFPGYSISNSKWIFQENDCHPEKTTKYFICSQAASHERSYICYSSQNNDKQRITTPIMNEAPATALAPTRLNRKGMLKISEWFVIVVSAGSGAHCGRRNENIRMVCHRCIGR